MTAAITLDAADNVAVALADVQPGEIVTVGAAEVEISQPIRAGHKLALRSIAEGAEVIKYGETIGIASSPIGKGDHVHVHNVVSGRLPGGGT